MVIGMREGIEENSRDNFILTICLKFLQCENVYRAPLQSTLISDGSLLSTSHLTLMLQSL